MIPEVLAPYIISSLGTLAGYMFYKTNMVKDTMTLGDKKQMRWLLGGTGTGKTTALSNMMKDDAKDGAILFINYKDQITADDLLEMFDDRDKSRVIYIDATDLEQMICFSLFGDPKSDLEKEQAIGNVIQIFLNIFGNGIMSASEDILRMCLMATIYDSTIPKTPLELFLIANRRDFRNKLTITDPLIGDFFTSKWDGLEKYGKIQPIQNKFRTMIGEKIPRYMLCFDRPRFNLEKAISEHKIIICNFNIERLSPVTAKILCATMLSNAQLVAFNRKDKSVPFFIYLDEYPQYISRENESFENLLSMGRAFNTPFVLSNQYFSQLIDERNNNKLLKAVDNNCSTRYYFRMNSPNDAQLLKAWLGDDYTINDLLTLENYHALAEILIEGKKTEKRIIKMPRPPKKYDTREWIIENSRKKYAVPIEYIEKSINKRWGITVPYTPSEGIL